jgi:HEPN domain-containing protein
MKTDENNPEDWYRSAKVRLGSADRLYPLEGISESVIELLQESAERYLKGYLISKGGHYRGQALIIDIQGESGEASRKTSVESRGTGPPSRCTATA